MFRIHKAGEICQGKSPRKGNFFAKIRHTTAKTAFSEIAVQARLFIDSFYFKDYSNMKITVTYFRSVNSYLWRRSRKERRSRFSFRYIED